jgi:transcriptional regulator with XRE-family HTH domain
MAKHTLPLFPPERRLARDLGLRLRQARKRRRMTMEELGERVGVTANTLSKLESGDFTVSFATVLRVLHVLGLSEDLNLLAAQDPQGRSIQDSTQVAPPRGRTVSRT